MRRRCYSNGYIQLLRIFEGKLQNYTLQIILKMAEQASVDAYVRPSQQKWQNEPLVVLAPSNYAAKELLVYDLISTIGPIIEGCDMQLNICYVKAVVGNIYAYSPFLDELSHSSSNIASQMMMRTDAKRYYGQAKLQQFWDLQVKWTSTDIRNAFIFSSSNKVSVSRQKIHACSSTPGSSLAVRRTTYFQQLHSICKMEPISQPESARQSQQYYIPLSTALKNTSDNPHLVWYSLSEFGTPKLRKRVCTHGEGA